MCSRCIEHRWTSLNYIARSSPKPWRSRMTALSFSLSVFEGDPEIHRIGTEIHHYVPHGHLAWLESLGTSSLHLQDTPKFYQARTPVDIWKEKLQEKLLIATGFPTGTQLNCFASILERCGNVQSTLEASSWEKNVKNTCGSSFCSLCLKNPDN